MPNPAVPDPAVPETAAPRLILASASPRRRELLLQAGFLFDIQSADVDETAHPGEDAVTLALRLARLKAQAVSDALPHASRLTALLPDQVILGADTVVTAPNGELLGKPADPAYADRMLTLLSGATHSVVTGLCVLSSDRIELAAALTWVTFQTLSAHEIDAYIYTGEPLGKAGAYAIQGRAARWIPHIQGDYTNVVGLPLPLTTNLLAPFNIHPQAISQE
jgi:septum formation protein